MGCENKKKKLEQALYERAIGFTQEDVSEEFGMVDNSLKLIKRKTSKKYYPPDCFTDFFLLVPFIHDPH